MRFDLAIRAVPALTAFATIVTLGVAQTAAAQTAPDEATAPAFTYQAVYTADFQGVVSGGLREGQEYLHNIDLVADLDLEKTVGWRGATVHAYVLNNAGGAPNDLAGTLQGVDNIEVAQQRTRLFELWLEQGFAGDRGSLRAGLYNLNSEFYVNDSAAQLINPSFGIGSELAATGPNGPSIFPSTGLGVRLNLDLNERLYARAALLNAKSGVVGDPGGVDTEFGDGVLVIAEAGITGPLRLGVGAWRYSEKQDDVRALTASGDPAQHTAQGVYVLGEHILYGDGEGRTATGFFRIGVSDGDTTPFGGGWQAGVQVTHVLASRPDSAFSAGVQQGRLDNKFKANLIDGGVRAADAETGFEITYSDRLSPRLTVQPDLQWIRHAGGDRDMAATFVAALRLRVDLGPAG